MRRRKDRKYSSSVLPVVSLPLQNLVSDGSIPREQYNIKLLISQYAIQNSGSSPPQNSGSRRSELFFPTSLICLFIIAISDRLSNLLTTA
eukprot:c1847_g1_i2 orf=3-269(-)